MTVGAVVIAEEGRPLEKVMSRTLATVHSDDKIDAAVNAIREASVRRVPIVDGKGIVVGMVALDDLVVLIAGELSAASSAIQANRGP